MNFNNVKVPKVPGGGAAFALIKVGILGALGVYGVANSLYNVEGGHRAVVFNRIYGIKDKVISSIFQFSVSLNGFAPRNVFVVAVDAFFW